MRELKTSSSVFKFPDEAKQAQLAAADLPSFYRVTPTVSSDGAFVIRLEFVYPAAMAEPREAKEPAGAAVRVEVGRVSRRLMAIDINVGAAVRAVASALPAPSIGSQVAHSIANALQNLKGGVAEGTGSRLNYEAAADGLKLDATLPPAWITEALKVQAESR